MDRISDVRPVEVRAESPDSSRLSMWTVIGAVCASVATAGILGSAAGILQIPTIAQDVTMLRGAKEDYGQRFALQSERLRSAELTNESLQRQINQAATRMEQMQVQLDRRDQADKTQDLHVERVLGELDTRLTKQMSELEGRSKDRNTEAMGATRALDATLAALQDRMKGNAEAVNALRQIVYDLAVRSTTPAVPLRQSTPGQLQSPPDGPPRRNAFRSDTPDRRPPPEFHLLDASVCRPPGQLAENGLTQPHVEDEKKSYSAHSGR